MKLTTAKQVLGVMAFATLASPCVLADDSRWDDAGWYIGGSLGQSKADIASQEIVSGLLGSGFSTSSIEIDDKDIGYKVFGGYQFNRYLALEGGFFDLGQFDFSTVTIPAGTLNGTMKIRGLNLDLVGYIPMGDKWSAFGRVGAAYAETKDSFSGSGAVVVGNDSLDERETNAKIGLGLQYAVSRALALRVEAERYRTPDGVGGKGDVDLMSAGFVYKFGTRSAPAPEPIAVAPEPLAAPAPAPKFEKQTVSATELFGFNSTEVLPAQPKLEAITNSLKGSNAPKNVLIVGHTDHLGSDSYNQDLSARRAEAVKDYMVSQGVDASRLRTEGRGESNPVVTCTETNKSALIECLAPNRRVEIDAVTITEDPRP